MGMKQQGLAIALLTVGLVLLASKALAEPPVPMPFTPVAEQATPYGQVPQFRGTQDTPLLRSHFGSQQLPKGTLLKIRFLEKLDSRVTNAGEPFTGVLTEDLMAPGGRLILPQGTTFRGRVTEASRPRFFSKGGALDVEFDHVVLSSGQQVPVDVDLSLTNARVVEGRFYADPGLGAKVANNLDKSADLIGSTIRAGADFGDSWGGNGLGKVVTVPVAAIGGGIAGAGMFTGKTVYSAVAPGEHVSITPDDLVLVELESDTAFPTEY